MVKLKKYSEDGKFVFDTLEGFRYNDQYSQGIEAIKSARLMMNYRPLKYTRIDVYVDTKLIATVYG